MVNCGVDIVEISRVKRAVERNHTFLKKVFSVSELEYFRSNGERFESLAGFFAAKEAFVKYKKIGIRGIRLSEISVEHESQGAPFLVFRGERQRVSLSISHNKDCAVAVICGEEQSDLPKNAEMKKLIPKRSADAHKGDCGRVFVVAGSEGMTGAAVLAARGALRTGCGLVTVGTAQTERPIVAVGVCEAMTLSLPSKEGKITIDATTKILEYAKKSDSVVFGPGLGQNEDIHFVLKTLLQEYEGLVVIDADGLNALSQNCEILKNKKCRVVITPHPGEMARLVKKPIEEIQQSRKRFATDFSKEFDVVVLLKGRETVVAEGERVFVNTTGNCGMATGGMGDVLSGVIASFMGQGSAPFEAAVLGAYIHGKAGDIAASRLGVHGMIAGDLADLLPLALKMELEDNERR